MSCDFPGTLLHAYLDGELDAVRAAEFERHLEDCRECTTTLGAIESLRSSFQRAQLYETAPPELRSKIRRELQGFSGCRVALARSSCCNPGGDRSSLVFPPAFPRHSS
jgi:mycothiol system anti-sigma-R factor